MASTPRPIAFILASTDHGTMIVNRFDYKMVGAYQGFGVGHMLLTHSQYDPSEASMVTQLLDARRRHFGNGVVALDIGANIGVFTVEWARHMTGWGEVLAFEAQMRVFHALCGNVAINNCFNARPVFGAVTREPGEMRIPVPNYFQPGSFGSLELQDRPGKEDIGQPIDYSEAQTMVVPARSIDSLGLARVDLMKIDVEGMEAEVLEGARQTVTRSLPIMVIEKIKSDEAGLTQYLEALGYRTFLVGLNILGIHPTDPTLNIVSVSQ